MSAAAIPCALRRGKRRRRQPVADRRRGRAGEFIEVLDTTIANVALPYIAGGMGVSEDEASWA